MNHLRIDIHQLYFVLFLGFCSCTGCDIDRTKVALSRGYDHPQLIDVSTGNCLVNDIEGDLTTREKAKLTNLMAKQLEDIFGESVVYLTTMPASRFQGKIPYEISAEQLDTLRKTTTYTYLLNVRVVKPVKASFDESVNVDLVIFDLDTRNIIYEQRVKAEEYRPENNSNFVFWLGHSDYNLMKNALLDALKDLKKGVRKFNKSQGKH
jgi:hypothetical protein